EAVIACSCSNDDINRTYRAIDDIADLPNDQAGLRPTDAHGARNAGRYSIPQRLQVGAFDEGDQIIASRDGLDLLDHRTIQLHFRQLFDQVLDACRLGLDQNIGLNHRSLLPVATRLPTGASRSSSGKGHQRYSAGARHNVELLLDPLVGRREWEDLL